MAWVVSAVVGAGTEFARQGLTARGLVGGTIAAVTGLVCGAICEEEVEFNGKKVAGELLKMVAVSLSINAISSAIITLLASQVTLGGTLALIGISVVGFLSHNFFKDQKDQLIKSSIKVCSLIVGLVGIELTGLVALKLLTPGSAVASMGLGFAGTGVAIIVGTAVGYVMQKNRQIDS